MNEYFREQDQIEENRDKSTEDPIYEGYKAVLDSKSFDETMVGTLSVCLKSLASLVLYFYYMHLHYFGDMSRHYMQVGNRGTQGTVTDFHGSSMSNWEMFFAISDTLL